MFDIEKELEVEFLRKVYPKGTRVKLVRDMEDPYTKIPIGTRGTVTNVDDIGTIHIRWDNGSSLGAMEGEITYEMCPRCGQRIVGYPATSRKDNKTQICSTCGLMEALEDWKEVE